MASLSSILESSKAPVGASDAETVNISVETDDSRVQGNKKHRTRRGAKKGKAKKIERDDSQQEESNNSSSSCDEDDSQEARRRRQLAMYQQHVKLMGREGSVEFQ